MKKPDKFKVPNLTTPKLIEWLLDQSDSVRSYDYCSSWLFCFDVKLHNLDLSFDHLLTVAKRDGNYAHGDDPLVIEELRQRHTDTGEEIIGNWAIEDSCQSVTGRNGKPDDDGWNQLWDGTPVDVRFEFMGRSGGWLVLCEFNDHTLNRECEFGEWSHKELRQLGEYLQWVKLNVDGRHDEVEHQAAFSFFANTCHDIETSDERTKELAEAHDYACRC